MTTLALILAFWLAASVAVAAAFSWLKRDDRRRDQANRVPWLDRDEEFWTDDEDELTEGERQEVRRSYGVEDFPWPKGGER